MRNVKSAHRIRRVAFPMKNMEPLVKSVVVAPECGIDRVISLLEEREAMDIRN